MADDRYTQLAEKVRQGTPWEAVANLREPLLQIMQEHPGANDESIARALDFFSTREGFASGAAVLTTLAGLRPDLGRKVTETIQVIDEVFGG